MRVYNSILTLSATVSAVCSAGDLIGFDDAPVLLEDMPVKGVAQNPVTEVGLDIGLTALGFDSVRAVGAITRGAQVVSATGGGVREALTGDEHIFATALTSAADGARVQILIR